MNLDDIGVIEPGNILRLLEELRLQALDKLCGGLSAEGDMARSGIAVAVILGEELLDSHRLIEREVGSEIGDAEATLTQYAVNAISAAAQGCIRS